MHNLFQPRTSNPGERGYNRICTMDEVLRDNLLVELAPRSAREIASRLLRATDSYVAENTHHTDDRTVVVLKVARE